MLRYTGMEQMAQDFLGLMDPQKASFQGTLQCSVANQNLTLFMLFKVVLLEKSSIKMVHVQSSRWVSNGLEPQKYAKTQENGPLFDGRAGQYVDDMGPLHKWGIPKMARCLRENPIKMDDLGVSLFQETTRSTSYHAFYLAVLQFGTAYLHPWQRISFKDWHICHIAYYLVLRLCENHYCPQLKHRMKWAMFDRYVKFTSG